VVWESYFDRGEQWNAPINLNHIEWLRLKNCEITPHLRRLESMTEEEAREVYEIEHGKDFRSDTYVSAKAYMIKGGELDYFTPQGFLHLLSKGFDIFGLIDAGLAKEVGG